MTNRLRTIEERVQCVDKESCSLYLLYTLFRVHILEFNENVEVEFIVITWRLCKLQLRNKLHRLSLSLLGAYVNSNYGINCIGSVYRH